MDSDEGPGLDKIKLRDVLTVNLEQRVLKGGLADILVPAASIHFRAQLFASQIVAHSATKAIFVAADIPSESRLYNAIDTALDADLIGKNEARARL